MIWLLIITYDFQKLKTIKSFAREIYNDNLTLEDALGEQINIKNEIDKFKKSTKPQNSNKKEKNHGILRMQLYFLKEDQKFL